MIIVGRNNTDTFVSKLVNNLNYLCKYRKIMLECGDTNGSSDTIVCRGKQLKTSKTAWTYSFNSLVYKVFYHYHYTSKLEVNKTYAPNILILGIPIKNRLDGYVKSNIESAIIYPLVNLIEREYFIVERYFFHDGGPLDRELFDRWYKDYSKSFIFINHIMEKKFKGTDEAESFSKAIEYLRFGCHSKITKSVSKDTDYWEKYENDLVNLFLKTDYTFSFKVARKEFKVDNFIPYFAIDTEKNRAYCNGFLSGVPIEDFIDKLYEKKINKGKNRLYPLSEDTDRISYTVRTVTGKYFTLGSMQ